MNKYKITLKGTAEYQLSKELATEIRVTSFSDLAVYLVGLVAGFEATNYCEVSEIHIELIK